MNTQFVTIYKTKEFTKEEKFFLSNIKNFSCNFEKEIILNKIFFTALLISENSKAKDSRNLEIENKIKFESIKYNSDYSSKVEIRTPKFLYDYFYEDGFKAKTIGEIVTVNWEELYYTREILDYLKEYSSYEEFIEYELDDLEKYYSSEDKYFKQLLKTSKKMFKYL